ncbi:MAG TPA: maleylacetate reductase [Gemmatimonadaceae bacterium]|nr:maleylacetate reductase [Gemmatimonadaceae bacterium]
MTSFVVDSNASRVVFGSGSFSRLPEELERLQCARPLLVSTPGRASLGDRAAELLGDAIGGRFDGAVVHVPEEVAVAARDIAYASRADCLVALGGGSSIGVAKAIALTSGLPIVAVPTTYGGSEMTSIWGITSGARKETGRNPKVQPRVVIYDPDLTVDLPPRVSAASGMNAIAHCIEALYAIDGNPLSSLAAERGITLLSNALPEIVANPQSTDASSRALEGAWLAGVSLGTVQMALHHKLCHTLGGAFDLPHAATHAVLLPYTTAFNRSAAAGAMATAAKALGGSDAPTALLDLAKSVGAPLSLQEIGMKESDIDLAASLAVEREYPNPRPVTRDEIRELLEAAFRGDADYVTDPASAG